MDETTAARLVAILDTYGAHSITIDRYGMLYAVADAGHMIPLADPPALVFGPNATERAEEEAAHALAVAEAKAAHKTAPAPLKPWYLRLPFGA